MYNEVIYPTDKLPLASAYTDQTPKRLDSGSSSDSPISYKDLAVVKKIYKGKLPIYLTASKINNQSYAMKVFHYEGESIHSHYKNEVRFASLNHPNIVNIIHCEDEQITKHWGQIKKVSYILMEYTPYGDFLKFINDHDPQIDEKLARTYFRQLIDGIECLHEHGGAHLDLKPENLLIGSDFNLKINDFDLSYMLGDDKIMSRGTRYYRAPEFYNFDSDTSPELLELEDPFAADIYSAGILLFILKCRTYPHAEIHLTEGVCLSDLMYQKNDEFWNQHCELQDRESSFFDSDFKELFNGMVRLNPKERLRINQIKESKWYNGPVYSYLELNKKMKEILDA